MTEYLMRDHVAAHYWASHIRSASPDVTCRVETRHGDAWLIGNRCGKSAKSHWIVFQKAARWDPATLEVGP